MGSRAVEAKIALAHVVKVKQTTNISNLVRGTLTGGLGASLSSSLYQVCPSRASASASHIVSRYDHQKSPTSLDLPINSCHLFLSKPHPMLLFYFSTFSNIFQSFDKMPQTDQHSHSTLIFRLLHLLKPFSTLRPDAITAIIVHCLAIKIGALAHLPTATSLLVFYSRAGAFDSSRALFYEIYDKDIIIWNAMITSSIENQCFLLAVDFFVKMIGEGSEFDSTSLLLAVSASSHVNNLRQGRNIHGLSLKSGLLLDSNLCNALIDMYAKCGDLSSSESVFAEMECRDIVSWNSIMSGCLYNSHPDKTLWYFREMTYSGERADHVSLSCGIAASASLGKTSPGEVIYAWGFKVGYDDNFHTSVANSVISLYSKCGDIEVAETVFRRMICKDVVSWNAMLDGFVSNGMILEAFDLMCEMQLLQAVQPDKVTIVSITPLCAELMLLREGRAIHGYVIHQQMGSDLSVANSLIDMYSKCNSVKKAKLLFNSIPKRDLVSWNTMISGYAQNGLSKEAQELFKELLHWCSHCSLSTLLAILPSCASPEGLQFGRSIHCWQLKLGFSKNIFAVNSLMHMYIYCGDLAAAFSLLQRISFMADVSCWNTIIVGCNQNCHFQEALETFNLMRQDANVSHDSITFVNVISACGNLELVSEGKSLHALALKTFAGLDTCVQNALITMYGRCRDIESATSVFQMTSNRNLCSWNCLISAFSQNKDGRRALELFCCLELEPNEITIVGILSACTQLGVLRHGKQIHGYTLRSGFQRNSVISAALVDMYSNCGRLDVAVQVFRYSHEKTVVAWNSMISAYGYHGNGRKAIDLFHEMCKSGLRATKSTFVSLLSACSHSGLVSEGVCYYNHMSEEYGVEPVTDHHVCMVDMLGRSGRLHEAFDFIKQLKSPPEPGVWGALLSACNYHGDLEIGSKVAELLFELEPQNVGYYISLSNMYVAAGSWKEAVELRNIVEEKQSKKPTGYSLIDIGFG